MTKQNWWELFPEVVPSPAARPRLPEPGAFARRDDRDFMGGGGGGVFDPPLPEPSAAFGPPMAQPDGEAKAAQASPESFGQDRGSASEIDAARDDAAYEAPGPAGSLKANDRGSAKSPEVRQAGEGAMRGRQAPAPVPWRQGGRMPPAEVERQADLGMRLYKIHRALGMSPERAAGWSANAVAEGHGNYRERQNNGRSPGFGHFQWGSNSPELDRRRTFKQVFGHPIQESSEPEQFQFRDWELAHSYRQLARQIDGASSAGEIAAAIARIYEHPADWRHAMLDRANIAEAIMRRARQMPDPDGPPRDPWQQGISGSGSGPVR